MYIEYEGLWVAGGGWLLTLAYTYWIWEDSQLHKTRAWPWVFLLSLGDPLSLYISNLYRYEILPSRDVYPYLVPLFKYDVGQILEPIWALDTLFLWSILRTVVTETITYMVLLWLYTDCRKSGRRATPWIFGARFVQIAPFPLNYFLPLAGYAGQIFILIGYILRKHGYI